MRLKFGPRLDSIQRTTAPANPPAEDPATKLDVEPEIADLDPTAEPMRATIRIPVYDLATHHRLTAVSGVVVPMGTDPLPATPEEWLASGHPKGEVDTTALTAGGDVFLDIPGVPDGMQVLQTILHFED